MNMIIDTYSMTPIYEQIVDSVKRMILSGELKENDALPSVRVLSRDLKISALTVKKAYDTLEEEGLTSTVHGKGTYVSAANRSLIQDPGSVCEHVEWTLGWAGFACGAAYGS